MKSLMNAAVPVLIVLLGAGCGASGKKLAQLDQSSRDQDKQIRDTMQRVDANASNIQENNNSLIALEKRLADLERKLDESKSADNAGLQEIQENIAFLNDQVLRLDNSIRTNKPAPRPSAPSAFKPGGFNVDSSYEAARADYEARRYESAISGFNEVLTVAPTGSLADNAQYWIGECYYALKNYQQALDAFTKVFNFPKSNKIADAHYKVAKSHLMLGNSDAAKQEFRTVIENYQGTTAAEYSKTELGRLGE